MIVVIWKPERPSPQQLSIFYTLTAKVISAASSILDGVDSGPVVDGEVTAKPFHRCACSQVPIHLLARVSLRKTKHVRCWSYY